MMSVHAQRLSVPDAQPAYPTPRPPVPDKEIGIPGTEAMGTESVKYLIVLRFGRMTNGIVELAAPFILAPKF